MNIQTLDITTVERGIVTHQVNAAGVMGKGLALRIRQQWPKVYEVYKMCPPRLGQIQMIGVAPDLWVCNLCGQQGWGQTGVFTDPRAVKDALQKLVIWRARHAPHLDVYIPYKMGCGLGGGFWDEAAGIIDVLVPDAIICQLEEK